MFSGVASSFIDLGNYFLEFGNSYGNQFDDGASFSNDASQPLDGLKNLGKGIATLCLSPFMFIIERAGLSSGLKEDPLVKQMLSPLAHLEKFVGDLLTGTMLILKGLVQLATFPMTWFIKVPIRKFVAWGSPTSESEDSFDEGVENNPGSYYEMTEEFERNDTPSAIPVEEHGLEEIEEEDPKIEQSKVAKHEDKPRPKPSDDEIHASDPLSYN